CWRSPPRVLHPWRERVLVRKVVDERRRELDELVLLDRARLDGPHVDPHVRRVEQAAPLRLDHDRDLAGLEVVALAHGLAALAGERVGLPARSVCRRPLERTEATVAGDADLVSELGTR